jgi:hypothetical protein
VPDADLYIGKVVSASGWIERSLTVSTETDRDCFPDCQYLHMDTADGGLVGELRKQTLSDEGTETDMRISIPEKFRTRDRFVKIECDAGCTGHSSGEEWETGRLGGKAACPDGTHIEIPILSVDANLAEEFCPNPKPSGFEQPSFARGTTSETRLLGEDLSPDANVRVGRWINGAFEDVPVTVSVLLPDPTDYYDTLIVSVSVPEGVAPRDDYDLLVTNPHVGAATCEECLTVT